MTDTELGRRVHGDDDNVARTVAERNNVGQHTQGKNVVGLILAAFVHRAQGSPSAGHTGKLAHQCHGHGIAGTVLATKATWIAIVIFMEMRLHVLIEVIAPLQQRRLWPSLLVD